MPSIDEFMQELFQAHVTAEQASLTGYDAFHRRFFVGDYTPFRDRSILRSWKSEKIDDITRSGDASIVTTTTTFMRQRVRYRYHLQPRDDNWSVVEVEAFCSICDGSGRFPNEQQCQRCKGTGWMALGR